MNPSVLLCVIVFVSLAFNIVQEVYVSELRKSNRTLININKQLVLKIHDTNWCVCTACVENRVKKGQ